jgi:hypothetical protein
VLIFRVETVFGLTTFYYSTKHKSFRDSQILNRYCKFMAVVFFVLYPVALGTLFEDSQLEIKGRKVEKAMPNAG